MEKPQQDGVGISGDYGLDIGSRDSILSGPHFFSGARPDAVDWFPIVPEKPALNPD